jgi:hypothetical protein
MRVTEAQVYIRERYGISWTGQWVRKMAHRGAFRFVRPGGDKGYLYISRESIDERFAAQPRGDF